MAPCPATPNCVSSRADAADLEHFASPFVLVGVVTQAWDRVRAALWNFPRTTMQEDTDTYLRVVVRSVVFRFPDDVEIQLDAAARRHRVTVS